MARHELLISAVSPNNQLKTKISGGRAARNCACPSIGFVRQETEEVAGRSATSSKRLGELCDFNRLYIGRIERGERVISFEYMQRIAFVLQVRPAELYDQLPVPRMRKKGGVKVKSRAGRRSPNLERSAMFI
jgi:hypothetical protein